MVQADSGGRSQGVGGAGCAEQEGGWKGVRGRGHSGHRGVFKVFGEGPAEKGESGSLQGAAEGRRKGQRAKRGGAAPSFWFRSGRGCGCAPGPPRLRGAPRLCGRASCASGAPSGPCGGGGGSGGLAGLAGRWQGDEEEEEQTAERRQGGQQEQKTGRTFHWELGQGCVELMDESAAASMRGFSDGWPGVGWSWEKLDQSTSGSETEALRRVWLF